MNETIFLVLASEERGGLFDFGATLPLVAVQFIVLMFVLNIIFYSPLTTLMNNRNDYVVSNLAKASEMIAEATLLTTQYEEKLIQTKKQAQQRLVQSQRKQNQAFTEELSLSQKEIEGLLNKVLENFAAKQSSILNSLTTVNNDVGNLSSAIYKDLFAN